MSKQSARLAPRVGCAPDDPTLPFGQVSQLRSEASPDTSGRMPIGPNDDIKSQLIVGEGAKKPLLVCIHGGGCNAGYFDLPGFSFRARAEARGYPLLLVNRPGHGGSGPSGGVDFRSAAAVISKHIEGVVEAHSPSRKWFLIGHSIGGAVSIVVAGENRPRGLSALAVSGIGDTPTSLAAAWFRQLGGLPIDGVLASDLLFGPSGSYSWRAPKALRHSAEPWQPAEVTETLDQWPAQWAGFAAKVEVPTHLRLAEAEQIWETGAVTVRRLASKFERASEVDAGMVPEGGHLYEVHYRGHELMESQLDFFDRITARLDLDDINPIPSTQ